MEKDLRSWFPHQHLDQQSLYQNFLGSPINTGFLNNAPATTPYTVGDSAIGISGMQWSKAKEMNDSRNWFYLPHFHQISAPLLKTLDKEKLPASPLENLGQKASPNMGTRHADKTFLVFDQSGGKTNLIYSSMVEAPIQCMAWKPNPPANCDLIKKEPTRCTKSPMVPIMKVEQVEDNYRDNLEGEMHEDTEELNALLCSGDDSDFSEDDEETSTGHSPNATTGYVIPDLINKRDVEVGSSSGPTKRWKLLDGSYKVPSLMDTASSFKTYKYSELEEDAESCCGNDINQNSEELGPLSGKKRSRKERIRETVSILQTIIPSVKGKDAIVVIDEAIDYLRSLQVEAKATGLDEL
ncbi:transcription factor bHLH [Forsythia ovata]|uniref:Transcription factor bHLH n=1 Tax=Forsythia ovata TaxID=205694 RepID=A0ABD1WYP3_9LAMI